MCAPGEWEAGGEQTTVRKTCYIGNGVMTKYVRKTTTNLVREEVGLESIDASGLCLPTIRHAVERNAKH
jgi:hypothetical protein